MSRVGETLTISGIYGMERNPAWRWWQFWRPRWLPMTELQTFRVIGATSSEITVDG